MKHLAPWILMAFLAGAASVRAQFTWVGNGSTGALLSDTANWQGGTAPTGVGGTENLVFNDIGVAPQTTILAPTSAFRDLTFQDPTRPLYTFNGTAGAVLTLFGTLQAQSGGNVTFNHSLGVALSTGSHTVDVSAGTIVQMNSDVSGAGGISLTGGGELRLAGVNTYAGGTIVDGNAVLTIDTGSVSHGSANTIIGQSGAADLYVQGGGDLSDATATIANLAGSGGAAYVSGIGSTWSNTTYLYVGAAGTGGLEITAGGAVSSPNVSVGNNTGGQGSLLVDGAGSQLNIGSTIYAGSLGYGQIYVQGGGSMSSTTASIGNNTGGAGGVISLSDAGTTWTNTGAILVGNATQGTLDVQNNASVTTNTLASGVLPGVSGYTLISGGGSLTTAGDLTAGSSGQATLSIDTAASVTTGGTAHLGVAGGSSGSVLLTGAGTSWTINQDLNIGESGLGQMFITSGAILNVAGVVRLGVNAGGAGSLYLGYDGEGYSSVGTLNLSTITTGAGTGNVTLGSTGTAAAPYYLTNTGLAGGTNIAIAGSTAVVTSSGYNVMSGTNTYTGGTSIYFGSTLVAGSNSALGTGSVNLNGGRLNVASGVTLSNPLVFVGTGSSLGGTGTFGSNVLVDSKLSLSPGNSPGTLSFSSGLTFAGGGTLNFEVQAANGIAGTGYDLLNISGGPLAITATSGSPFTINLYSLNGSGVAGNVADFTSSSGYAWMIATSSSGITGFAPTSFVLNTSNFSNSLGTGAFYLTQSGNNLMLNFSPVPEPATWALLFVGVAGLGFRLRRRRP